MEQPADNQDHTTQQIPDEIRRSLARVIEHLWDDEHADYDANPSDEHIFSSLKIIDRWLGTNHDD